ncbi:MAG: AMP-binding protein, partial [Nitrospira sp.]|nr:AMP-binding protein [Nitrospira sp.]
MIETISMNKNIQEAHRNGTPLFQFPFTSFAQFFHGRVADPDLMKEVYLTYYDDSGMVRSYTYEEFGNTVNRTVTFLREQLGVHRGDRIAILLFNHDFTVVMYYAAWVLGAVV